jgi:hypothetical protein
MIGLMAGGAAVVAAVVVLVLILVAGPPGPNIKKSNARPMEELCEDRSGADSKKESIRLYAEFRAHAPKKLTKDFNAYIKMMKKAPFYTEDDWEDMDRDERKKAERKLEDLADELPNKAAENVSEWIFEECMALYY